MPVRRRTGAPGPGSVEKSLRGARPRRSPPGRESGDCGSDVSSRRFPDVVPAVPPVPARDLIDWAQPVGGRGCPPPGRALSREAMCGRAVAELPPASDLGCHGRDLHHRGAGGGGAVPGCRGDRASVVAGADGGPVAARPRPCRGQPRSRDVHHGRRRAPRAAARRVPTARHALYSAARHGGGGARRLSRDRKPQPARPAARHGRRLRAPDRGHGLRLRP